MSFDDLDAEARRLYQELESGHIDREQYYSEIVDLLILPLYSLFYSLGINRKEDKDDLFQQVMVKFLTAPNRPDLSVGLQLPWFRTVARNGWIDELRKAKPSVAIDDKSSSSETRRSVEDSRILSVEKQNALANMSPEVREVAGLYFTERLTQKEIAETLGIPEKTVNYYVGLARKHLSARLKDFTPKTIQESESNA
jgi:RNA polymerase sigma factor (sigma-70 family)